MRGIHKHLTVSVALIALVITAAACTKRKVLQVGSHKVTIARHGFEKKFTFDLKAEVPSLEYAGISTDGHGLKVFIKGDQVRINGEAGQLRPGDTVLIVDNGLLVNQMDFGETAKYLRENSAASNTSALQ